MTREKDQELLAKIRKKNIQHNPAAILVACQLSPSLIYLRSSPYGNSRVTESEVYCRSEKNRLTKDTRFLYSAHKKELTMGLNAHLGNYQNIMQKSGDSYVPSEKREYTSTGSSELHDTILEYKKSLCLQVESDSKTTKYIKIIYANSFPCIMVHVQKNSIINVAGEKKLTDASHKAWVEFLISVFTGMINYYAYEQNIHIELERRSSFGFSTPTICETGESFRISMGLVPEIYANIITATLHKLDELISSLHKSRIKVSPEIFYGKKIHEDYLGKNISPINNLLHVLFLPVETKSGLGVRNITRTSYARQGLSMVMFNKLQQGGSPLEGFAKALSWSVKKIDVKPNGYRVVDGERELKYSLKFDCSEDVKYSQVFNKKCIALDDKAFWALIHDLVNNVRKVKKIISKKKSANSNKLQDLYVELELRSKKITAENIESKQLQYLYYNLEMLNEIIFAISLLEKSFENTDDGYGSDSECEGEIEETHLYAKKIITHNGMRAIWCALIAASRYLSDQKLKQRVFMKTAYYEVEKGFKKLISLHDIDGITIVNNTSEASILIHDLNACVTDGSINPDYTLTNANKVLILDVTSSTASQVKTHLKRFSESRAAVLFLVDSGFKNQQLGADKNQYGTVRVFTKSKKSTDKIYDNMLKDEEPILSMTSHVLRRNMKQIGVVPTNKNYMKL